MTTPDETTPLGIQAFSIYCDNLARDAKEKNNKIRTENAALEKVFALAQTVVFAHFNKSFKLTHIPVQRFVEEAPDASDHEAYMVCNMRSDGEDDDVSIEFPWEHIMRVYFFISGVYLVDTLRGGPEPEFEVLEDEQVIQVKLVFLNAHAIFIGRILGLSGSVDDMHHLIDSNQITAHYIHRGLMARDDVEGRLVQPAFLKNATFIVDQISIRKSILQTALECAKGVESSQSLRVKELITLARSNPTHKVLQNVAEESRQLERYNATCHVSRERIRNVEAWYPGAEHPVRLKLENGNRQNTINDVPGWILDVPDDGEGSSTIPLHSINKLQFLLAKSVPLTRPMMLLPEFLRHSMTFIARYGPTTVGVYMFDDSLGNMELDNGIDTEGFIRYVRAALLFADDEGMMMNYPGQQFDCSSLTMRLVQVQVELVEVNHILVVLGIDASEKSGEEE